MRLTVLGGRGGWPDAGHACSGYLIEHDGFRLLLDPGYATTPRLLEHAAAAEVDAVYVSHGHPDHCADLNPLLRARALADEPAPPLPVYALAGSLDAVLALDRPGMLAKAYELREFTPGDDLEIGPFRAATCVLPHWLPNAGVRLAADGSTVAYTGDTGPSPDIATLARDADLLIADATYATDVPDGSVPYLSSAADAGRHAARAGAEALMLAHLWPGTDVAAAQDAAAASFSGPIRAAASGLRVSVG